MLVVANSKTLIYLLPKILKFDWKASLSLVDFGSRMLYSPKNFLLSD